MSVFQSFLDFLSLGEKVAASHVDRATANLAAQNPNEALHLLRKEHAEKIGGLTQQLQGLKAILQREAADVTRVQGEVNQLATALQTLKQSGRPDDDSTVIELATKLQEGLATLERERAEEAAAQEAVTKMERDIVTIGTNFHAQVAAVERQLTAHQGEKARLEIAQIQAGMAQEVAGISTSFASTIEAGLAKSQAGMAQEVAGLNAKAAHLRDGADPHRGVSPEARAALEAAARPQQMSVTELLAKAAATKK